MMGYFLKISDIICFLLRSKQQINQFINHLIIDFCSFRLKFRLIKKIISKKL